MVIDPQRLTRARRAIYGPMVLAVVGTVLCAAGVAGVTTAGGTRPSLSGSPDQPQSVSATEKVGKTGAVLDRYALVAQSGRIYRPDAGQPITTPLPADAVIVGAAPSPDGGLWLASNDGRVFGAGTRSLGEHRLDGHGARIIGITSMIAGYWLAAADGHVYPCGAALDYGNLAREATSPVTAIASPGDGGYWLTSADGRVEAFGDGAVLRGLTDPPAAPIVGMAAASPSGFWLVDAGGRVYPFGTHFFGDLRHSTMRERIVGIAAAPNGGYWLARSDGRVFGYGTRTKQPPQLVAGDRIVAIVAM